METRQIALLFAVRLALSALLLWLTWRMGPVPFVLSIPGAGVLLAKPIIEAGGSWFHWARRQPYAEWQGNYYEFAGTQIRMIAVGAELWAVDADLLRVVGEKPSLMLGSLYDGNDYGDIPGTRLQGFSPAGAEKVLRKSAHHEAPRLLLWLQREVYRPHQRKRESAAIPKLEH